MNKKMIIAVLLLALFGCNNKRAKNNIDYQTFINTEKLVSQKQVQRFKMLGWQPLSSQYLVLRSSHQRSFLIKLQSKCQDLPYANNIILIQDMERSLKVNFDKVDVPGQIGPACRIEKIYELNKKQRKNLLDFANQTEQIRVSTTKHG